MSKFVTEPGEMVLAGEAGPPLTPCQLFMDLGVFGESDAVWRTELAEWLRDNEPVPILRMALEFRGLIDTNGNAIPGDRAAGA